MFIAFVWATQTRTVEHLMTAIISAFDTVESLCDLLVTAFHRAFSFPNIKKLAGSILHAEKFCTFVANN